MSDDEKPKLKIRRRKKVRRATKKPRQSEGVEIMPVDSGSETDPDPDCFMEDSTSILEGLAEPKLELSDCDDETEDQRLKDIREKFVQGLFDQIQKYSDEIFAETTNTLVQDVIDYIHQSEEDEVLDEWIDDTWKRGLEPAEIQKRTQQLKELMKDLDKDLPTMSQILDSDLKNEEKARAIQLYDLMNSLPKFSIEYNATKAVLLDTLGKHPVLSEQELDKCKELDDKMSKTRPSKISLKQRVFLSQHNEENMRVLYDMAVRLENMPINDSEYAGLKDVFDTALALPVNKSIIPVVGPDDPPEKVNQFLVNLRQIFDEEIFGMHDVKDYIIEIIGTRISNPDAVGDVIAFEGPPGTGKTLFVKCIAKALGLPLEIISLAGAHDPSYIEGFLSTYSKSTYGRLIGAMKKMQCDNGLILWDEADKIDENRATAVSGPLIAIFDPEQNHAFKDKFLGDITTNVGKILHFATMNNRKNVNFIAADRMDIVKVRPPKLEEKVGAAKLKIIPEIFKKIKIKREEIIFGNENETEDEVIAYIITRSNKDSKQEPGMRQINITWIKC